MISESRANELLIEYLRDYCKKLKLSHWKIKTKFEHLEEKIVGMCNHDSKYNEAVISLDLSQIDDEKEFLDILQHELIHCIMGDLQIAKDVGCAAMSATEMRKYFESFDHGIERAVTIVQRIIFKEQDD